MSSASNENRTIPANAASSFGKSIVFLALGCGLALGLWWISQRSDTPPVDERPLAPPRGMSPLTSTPFIIPGVRLPPVKKADEAALDDNVEIIGVESNRLQRAYAIPALKNVSTSVINDVLGRTPISVTYCARTDGAQVYSDSSALEPLDISHGGIKEKTLLKAKNGFFFYDTGLAISTADQIPHAFHPFERMTWKQWREKHPATDVFVGMPPSSGGPGAPNMKLGAIKARTMPGAPKDESEK